MVSCGHNNLFERLIESIYHSVPRNICVARLARTVRPVCTRHTRCVRTCVMNQRWIRVGLRLVGMLYGLVLFAKECF
jgi:hypothetical protein